MTDSTSHLNIKELYEEELETIWANVSSSELYRKNTEAKSIIRRGFCAPETLEKGVDVLYIGINPSYDARSDAEKFYVLDTNGESEHRYFKKFKEQTDSKKLKHYKKLSWSHLDLLFLREREQKKINLFENERYGDLEFIWEQLQVSKAILEQLSPKIIVVNNTKARQYLGKDKDHGKERNIWLGYNFEWVEEWGTYIITNEDSKLKGAPVFFSGMFTGQRALDNGSFERLTWQIQRLYGLLG